MPSALCEKLSTLNSQLSNPQLSTLQLSTLNSPLSTLNVYSSLHDLLFPRLCSGCGQRLALDERYICGECSVQLPFETGHDWTSNRRMHQWADHMCLERIGALMRYEHDNVAAGIIRSLKYNRRFELGRWMGRMAVEHLADSGLFAGVDVLLPLPLTRARFRFRGFNQAEYIARGMAEVLGVPVLTRTLRRVVERESQTHFTHDQRLLNARHVFELQEADGLEGRHVMLVDDVMTTGTTLLGALEVVEQMPRVRISCFAWAWVMLSGASMARSRAGEHT